MINEEPVSKDRHNSQGGFMMKPVKLAPVFKDYLWGGTRLKEEFNKRSDLEIMAESWELSTHPDGESRILNGAFHGLTLRSYLNQVGYQVLGTVCENQKELPILIKFIDSKQSLSIQVHPDDEYALRVENDFGKTEMWLILDCEPDATLYYGVKEEISKEEFKARIEQNTILEVLNEVPVKKGDVFFIEAGTIHAIKEGIVILEIQQSSNATYRIYDYNRKDAHGNLRELHIEKALDVTKLTPSNEAYMPQGDVEKYDGYQSQLLRQCNYFTTKRYDVSSSVQLTVNPTSFQSIIVIAGSGELLYQDEVMQIKKGDSLFIPAQDAKYEVKGQCQFVLTYVE